MKKFILLLFVCLLTMPLMADPRDRGEVERELVILNDILALEDASWEAGITDMALLSLEDVFNSMGLIPPAPSTETFVMDRASWPPAGQEFIVSDVPAVKNQAQCGSCVAFGTTAAFEQTYAKKNGSAKLFSERYLFFCSPYKGYGCNSGWSLNGGAVAASQSSKGMIESKNCPYFDSAYHYDCGAGCNTSVQKYTMPYKSLSSSGYMSVLNQGRAIIIGMTCFEDFRYYKDGIYEHLQGGQLGGHCMVLVGYGTSSDGKHYWVVKNSWGTNWGKQGYLRIRIKPEQKNQDSNIEDYGAYYFP